MQHYPLIPLRDHQCNPFIRSSYRNDFQDTVTSHCYVLRYLILNKFISGDDGDVTFQQKRYKMVDTFSVEQCNTDICFKGHFWKDLFL